MATPAPSTHPGPDHLVTIKVLVNDEHTRRFKLPLKDLKANVLPEKLRTLLAVGPCEKVILERYSDSAACYVTLDNNNTAVYKQLFRAAKAKSKLRIKATVTSVAPDTAFNLAGVPDTQNPVPFNNYLGTVLNSPPPIAQGGILPSVAPLEPTIPYPMSSYNETPAREVKEHPTASPQYRKFEPEQDTLPFPAISHRTPRGMFCIDCNNCGRSIPNEHYHCGVCENGDYDLCERCFIDYSGCLDDDHWLVKRSVVDGMVVSSVTERVPPRQTRVGPYVTSEDPSPNVTHEDSNDPYPMDPYIDPPAAPESATGKPTDSSGSIPTALGISEFPKDTLVNLVDRSITSQAQAGQTPQVAFDGLYTTAPPIQEKAIEEIPTASESVSNTPESPLKATNIRFAGHDEDKPVCNGCCNECDESNLVRCKDCEDYDLCLRCLLRNKHGHHPAHTFDLGDDHNFCLKNLIVSRCLPGRQFKHGAICDGCQKQIHGVRHKCLTCPDWDYCRECFKNINETHPGHRFAPLYENIKEQSRGHVVHTGIFCDGPLCKGKPAQRYIIGDRYRCTICHDLDFCANCEALPTLNHNHTHPLLKFRTSVRSCSISTFIAEVDSEKIPDAEVAHTSPPEEKKPVREQAPVEVDAGKPASVTNPVPVEADESGFTAHFMRDSIADGTQMSPSHSFNQTWTLYNPGPSAWPAGSDVRFVGGDAMFDVDSTYPSSLSTIRLAMESNKLTAPLEPGNSADFTVHLRSPPRECTAISYWRLKLPNGTPIGHRLWCDIQVRANAEPVEAADSVKYEAPSTKSAEVSAATSPQTHESGMVFPKLEKESPESSTHEAAAPLRPAPTVSSVSGDDVLDEEVESLTLDDVETDDAGFLTDEEYDVLDASDQEFLEAKQSLK